MSNEQKNYLLELTTQLSNINGSLLDLGQEIEDSSEFQVIVKAATAQIGVVESLKELCQK